MIIPSQVVTCLPTFDAAAVCHLHASSSTPTQSSFRLAGKPGGLLYVEQQQQQPQQSPTAQTTAALQGWSKWLIQHNHDNDKASMHILAKPYLQLGFLFGEPEFGLSPEVALPMYLTETTDDDNNSDNNNHNTVTIASTEIGKQLACTVDGNLYSASTSPGLASPPTTDAVWRCDWQTPEICCIISAAQGLRLSLCEEEDQQQQQYNDDTRDIDDGYPSVQPTMSSSGASVRLVQSYASSVGPESTHWRLIEQGDGTVAIVSHNERYVLGDDWQNTVTLSCPEPGPVPRWRVVKTCARGVRLQSVATQRFLQVDAAGRFSTQPPPQEENDDHHHQVTTTTTSHDATNRDTNAALFWLEPIHGSTFTIQHVKHQKATKNNSNNNKNDLQNVLIKVFDNGNVIIKRDGQFFGECYWQDKFVGVGFANAPYVWNFEPTAAGPIRIVSAASSSSSLSQKKYLSYDGKSFGLGPWEETDTKDVANDDANDKTARNAKAKTAAVNDDDNNNNPENDKFLWHLKPKNDKITIGMRYGLLPKHIQKQAKKKFVDMHPFRPTLAMAGELHRPFANWRAWPVQQPKEGSAVAVPTIIVNGHEEPVNTQNNGVLTMSTPTSAPEEPPVVAAAAATTTTPVPAPPQETPAWVSAPPPLAPVTAPPPPAATATTAATTPIVSSPDLILPQPEMELETPVPTAQEIAAFQKSIAEQQAKQQEKFEQQQQQQEQATTLPPQPETPTQQQTPPLQETPSSLTPAPDAHIPAEANPPTFSVAETPPQPSPLPANNEQQQEPAQDGESLRFFDAQEGFNFLKADANNGPQTTPGTQWPENTVNPQEAPPPAVPATRTMNGRPLPADNVTSYGRGGPNYSSSSSSGGGGEEPSGPRIFTVDRT